MKFMAILAAAMLALGPTIASAGPTTTATYERPAPGPVASQTDDDNFDTGGIILFGGTFGLGLLLLALLGGGDGSDTTTTTTTTTTSQ